MPNRTNPQRRATKAATAAALLATVTLTACGPSPWQTLFDDLKCWNDTQSQDTTPDRCLPTAYDQGDGGGGYGGR